MTRRCYAVLAKVSLSYPPLQGRLVTCYSPVRHFTQVLLPFLVRLACVRHAASVDSEPGSNSRLKPDVGSPLTEVSERPTASAHLDSDLAGKEGARRCSYLVRMIKPNSITSHDWHVQPICQRSLRTARLSGAPFGSKPPCCYTGRVLELLRAGSEYGCLDASGVNPEPRSLLPRGEAAEATPSFCANFSRLSQRGVGSQPEISFFLD